MLYILNLILSILLLFNQNIYTQNTNFQIGHSIEEINNKNSNSDDSFLQKGKYFISNTVKKIENTAHLLFSKSGSIWVKFLAALLLGLLLSLTPCMFPMIPITVGILQINSSTSKVRGFLTSLSYTFGISLTFAIFGFVVAIGSYIFGDFQGSPWVIIPLSALLVYFGLSMFDFYEIKIPKFLRAKTPDVKQGSLLSAFLFGAISGTVASPCLSPGLALILDYVSQLSHTATALGYLEGFILLFIFGIGSSLPLLIIGTFSNSLNLMPRAGSWMLEVKKLVGIMLIGMAFYNLFKLEQYIPSIILMGAFSLTFLALSAYYFYNIKSTDSLRVTIYKYIVSIILLITSVYPVYSRIFNKSANNKNVENIWLNDFDKAIKKAKEENKSLFIDLGSSFCAACKSIDKSVFANSQVINLLKDKYVAVKINYDVERESFNSINNLWGPIKGFPTYIIVFDNKLVKKMGSELGDLNISDILKLLTEHSNS